MWNSISGEITRKALEVLHLQSSDMEWEFTASSQTLDSLPPVGQRAKIFSYLQHTEDQMKLFGFATIQERSLFLDLIKVNGVGPKLAIKILSGLKYTEIQLALENGDTAKLSKAPGVGLKTAQKIVLSLKGKLQLDNEPIGYGGLKAELISSLAEMGFDRKSSEKAVNHFWDDSDLKDLTDSEKEKILFQRALLRLTKDA